LKAIKNWYEDSDSEYALFLEDDVTLQTAQYWNFTWEEFINELPSDWDCVQLTCIKENLSEVKLREREWNDWSVTGYIITRKYAKLLIDTYFKEDNTIHLYTNEGTTYPCIENVIYTLGKVYCIPLLVENVNFNSTFYGKTINEPHKQDHVSSANFVMNWWKQNGKQTNIKELCKIY
jgi:GR25 family glycosyltransferase involved in LPS biosynthesis